MTSLVCSLCACSSRVTMCNHSVSHRPKPLRSPIRSQGWLTSTWQINRTMNSVTPWLDRYRAKLQCKLSDLSLSKIKQQHSSHIRRLMPALFYAHVWLQVHHDPTLCVGNGRTCTNWLSKYIHISVCFFAGVATPIEFARGQSLYETDNRDVHCHLLLSLKHMPISLLNN